jgi:protein sprouty family protein 2
MCAVRAARYHCGGGEDDASDAAASSPCSCSGPASAVAARWLCLGAASLVAPCLCCYLPLKCCVRAAEAVYQRATDHGCRCAKRPPLSSSSSTTSNGSSPVVSTPPLPLPTANPTSRSHASAEKRLLVG